jgi:HlyD family type I secretion membrane fusion protein
MDYKSPLNDEQQVKNMPDIARPYRIGMVIISVFFLFFFLWSILFPLDKAAITNGMIVVDSERRVVQHLEGGVIDKILIKEGDVVKKNQVLILLSPTQAIAKKNTAEIRFIELVAKEARLIAERDDSQSIQFPSFLTDSTFQDKVHEVIHSEKGIFNDNASTLQKMLANLDEKIKFLHTQSEDLQAQIDAEAKRYEYAFKEVQAVRSLLGKKFVSETDVWRLEQLALSVKSSLNEHKAELATANQQLAQTQLQITTVKSDRKKETLSDLKKTQEALSEVKETLDAASDILTRITIRSPINGTIVNLQHLSEGGVIKPGELILEVVPQKDTLVIEAQLQTHDIDMVHTGMPAKVQLTAYLSRRVPMVTGTLTHISADALKEERTGQYYYKIKVLIDKHQLDKLKHVKLYPGMPAQVSLIVEQRTFWDYLITPITTSLDKSFTED